MTRRRRAARRRLLAGMKRAVRDYLRGAVPLSLTLAVVEIHRERAAMLGFKLPPLPWDTNGDSVSPAEE